MDKDPTTYSLITYIWITALSAWGGIVNWLRKRREGSTRPFNFVELIGELMTSAFAGVLTFWLAESAEIQPLVTAALVGVSGHMGSRAIYMLESVAESKFGGRRHDHP